MVDVAQIEMCFEEVRLEADRAFVERLRLHELVAAVVDVRQIDERRDETWIVLQRLSIGGCRVVLPVFVAVVERGRGAEVLLGEIDVADRHSGSFLVGRRRLPRSV